MNIYIDSNTFSVLFMKNSNQIGKTALLVYEATGLYD